MLLEPPAPVLPAEKRPSSCRLEQPLQPNSLVKVTRDVGERGSRCPEPMHPTSHYFQGTLFEKARSFVIWLGIWVPSGPQSFSRRTTPALYLTGCIPVFPASELIPPTETTRVATCCQAPLRGPQGRGPSAGLRRGKPDFTLLTRSLGKTAALGAAWGARFRGCCSCRLEKGSRPTEAWIRASPPGLGPGRSKPPEPWGCAAARAPESGLAQPVTRCAPRGDRVVRAGDG